LYIILPNRFRFSHCALHTYIGWFENKTTLYNIYICVCIYMYVYIYILYTETVRCTRYACVYIIIIIHDDDNNNNYINVLYYNKSSSDQKHKDWNSLYLLSHTTHFPFSLSFNIFFPSRIQYTSIRYFLLW